MISVREARDRVLSAVRPLGAERVPIVRALGRVAAEEVISAVTIPPLANSAMDGFAVRAADLRGASRERPAALKVLRDLPAGYVSDTAVGPGQAIRIMTGAPVPPGADAVVRKEDAESAGGEVRIFVEAPAGKDIRPAGEDVRPGDAVLAPGDLIRPAEVGVLASVNVPSVLVRMRPRVAILSTGDELVEVGGPLGPGKIVNSNSYSLAALVAAAGGVPMQLGIARDTPEALREKLAEARAADAIVTSGGVSVGDYDFVKDVLAEMGAEMSFWKVAMKPGKPQAFGLIDGRPVFGLPGNPVSTMVSFEMFVRPALRKMMGHRALFRRVLRARLEGGARKGAGMIHFNRVILAPEGEGWVARSTGTQSSGALRSMSLATGLAALPAEATEIAPGDFVDVMVIDESPLAAETRDF